MMRRIRWCAVVVAVTAIGMGCGGGGDDDGGGSAKGPRTLKVGVLPIADVAPLYLGMQKGFFAREGLKIEPQPAQGGAAIVPKLVSGEAQIGFSNAISLIIAASKGLPVRIISQGDQGGDSSGLFVAPNSPIGTAKDLEGKRIAVVTLKNNATLSVSRIMEKAGADFHKAQFVELPFADMAQAVKSGRVDAAVTIEPFTTLNERAGLRKIARPLEEVAPRITVAPYFTTKRFMDQDPDAVERFVRAMNRSLDYAEAHQDEVRAIVPTYTKIPPAAAKAMGLPHWSSDLNVASIQLQAELSRRYGYISELPAIDELIAGPKGS
jgi:NitT/TauT family transport system substrate-binding protein